MKDMVFNRSDISDSEDLCDSYKIIYQFLLEIPITTTKQKARKDLNNDRSSENMYFSLFCFVLLFSDTGQPFNVI